MTMIARTTPRERSRRKVRLASVLVGAIALLALAASTAAVAEAHHRPVAVAPQVIPQELDRVFGADNANLDIDGIDDERVDVDIAVLDTGVDLENPDIDVVGRTNCEGATEAELDEAPFGCTSASPTDGHDSEAGHWHGTGVATRIAAIDNGIGRVGVAPGARVWAVDIHDDDLYTPPVVLDLESTIAGVKWVTEHADEIEVVYGSFGCQPGQTDPAAKLRCGPDPDSLDAGERIPRLVEKLEAAVRASIEAGVVYVVPANPYDLGQSILTPHRMVDGNGDPYDGLLVGSTVVDTDGKPGYLGPTGPCGSYEDDKMRPGIWGEHSDLATAGCVPSDVVPMITGAAALRASMNNPDDEADVIQINNDLINAGNDGYTDDNPPDGVVEPLLDLGSTQAKRDVFDPVMTTGSHPTPGGWDYDLKTRCIKSATSALPNYYEDTTQCTSGGGKWLAFVSARDATPQSGCPGASAPQAFPVNGSGSPTTLQWYQYWGSPLGPNWTINVKLDNVYTSAPCVDSDTIIQFGVADHIHAGGGPLPNPRSLTTSHQVAYGEWRPSGGTTRLIAGAIFQWAGKAHRIEVNLHSGGIPDTHPHPDVVSIDTQDGAERVIYDGAALGVGVASDYTGATPTIDWKQLVKQASDQGWLATPMTRDAQTIAVHLGVEVKGDDALTNLWTTSFRANGK